MANFTGAELPVVLESGLWTNVVGVLIPVVIESGYAGAAPVGLTLTFLDPIPPDLPSHGRALLFNVTGVGPLTALTFVLTIRSVEPG